MFERFAEEARRATALASEEAREFGHDFIGTEHLLLGLLATGEGTAFSVLSELEVTLDDGRRRVSERVHAYGKGSLDSPPFTPLAKKSLERALRESLKLKSNVIGTEHLLLGLLAVPDGGGARILVELVGSLDQVREAVLVRVVPAAKAEASLEQTKAPVSSKTLRRWANQGLLVFRPTGATGGAAGAPAGATGAPGGATGAPGGATGAPGGEAEAATTTASPRTTLESGAEADGPPPRCPACQTSLAAAARYRELLISPDEGGEGDQLLPEPLAVTVVFCRQCGTTLGVA
jgi:hypothetical protein